MTQNVPAIDYSNEEMTRKKIKGYKIVQSMWTIGYVDMKTSRCIVACYKSEHNILRI
jgi:hypothetical protein